MKMAKRVPVFKVKVPWSIKRLDEVHDAICMHCKGIE